jgi:hypothetical protein
MSDKTMDYSVTMVPVEGYQSPREDKKEGERLWFLVQEE